MDDIEETDIEEDDIIKCEKIALTISLHNLTEFLITKIRINNFVTQIDEIPY